VRQANLTGDDEFDRHVSNVLRVMKQQPGYVLGVTDQVPSNALERRARRIGELVAEIGRYE
jgi:hypothetical protein